MQKTQQIFTIDDLISQNHFIFGEFLNYLHEGICILDVNKKIKVWNKGAEKITGHLSSTVIGNYTYNNILQFYNTKKISFLDSKNPISIAINTGIYKSERVYLKDNGGYFIPIWAHITPIKNDADEVVGVVVYFHDDSGYEALKLSEHKLKQANELNINLLGMASHDLKNPLSSILMSCEMIDNFDTKNLTKDQLLALDNIKKHSHKMLLLIEDLLDISSVETCEVKLNKTNEHIEMFLNDQLNSMHLQAKKKDIKIILDIEPDIPDINIDIERMSLVLNNLISNAIKFSYPNSTITVKASCKNDHFILSVIDNGQGIPKNEIKKLFKPFTRTSVKPTAKEKSTGLGLAIVKKIIDLHDGRIKVYSEENKGSEFTIILPLN